MAGKDGNPRTEVYDLLGELSESGIPHGLKLLAMGGEKAMAMADGFIFEKGSWEYLDQLAEISVSDEQGTEVGRLPNRDAVFRAFNIEHPPWIEEGKSYKVNFPDVPEADFQTLHQLRDTIHERLQEEGFEAAQEFRLARIAMGGEERDPETIAKEISLILSGLRK